MLFKFNLTFLLNFTSSLLLNNKCVFEMLNIDNIKLSLQGFLLHQFQVDHNCFTEPIFVTSGCWWLYVGDNLWVLVKEFRQWWRSFGCWCPTLILTDRAYWWRKQRRPSSKLQSQHIPSPTSITNIDVADFAAEKLNSHCEYRIDI